MPSRNGEPGLPWGWILPAAACVHFGALTSVVGVTWDYVVLDGVLLVLALSGGRALALARAIFPLWLTGVLYLNLQPLMLPYRGPILTGELAALDAAMFPAPGGAGWPAYFAGHTHVALDVIAGFAYLVYLFQFFGVFLFLYVRNRPEARKMAWCFFAVNVLGIAIYLTFPAAPPWYVQAHGPGPADLSAPPSAAGALRFDTLFGIGYFQAFYAKNPNVFGAMPSLHVAYPTVAAGFLARRGVGAATAGVAFAVWVAFSAVYLVHHYMLDVVAGAGVGLAAFALIERLSRWAPIAAWE